MRRLAFTAACAVVCCAACSQHWLAPPNTSGPAAFASARQAEFVFPNTAPRLFLPTHEDSAQGYPKEGFIWSVSWDTEEEPHALEARSESALGQPPATDTLAAIVARARFSHLVYVEESEPPASRLVPEPALGAAVRHGQVVLRVDGKDALRRLWRSGIPDSVTFFWRGPGDQTEEVKVPLSRAP